MPDAGRSLALATALSVALAATLLVTAPAAAQPGRWIGDGGDGWLAATGVFDTAHDPYEAELTVGYSLPHRVFPGRWCELQPEVGLSYNDEGGLWLWSALLWPNELGERWLLVPFTGLAVYENGDGKDLGGLVEFRTGIELAYRLDERSVGVAFYHLSNAGIYDSNPGANSLVLTLRW